MENAVRYRRYTALDTDTPDLTVIRVWEPRASEFAQFDIIRVLTGGPYKVRKHGDAFAEYGRLADAKERLERS